jgi:hypothetical protein
VKARSIVALSLLVTATARAETLENDRLRVEVSEETGSLVSLVDKRSGQELITDAQQVRLFQLLLPTIGERTRRIQSWQQRAEVRRHAPDHLEIRYAGLRPDEQQYVFGSGVMHFAEPALDIAAVVDLRLEDEHVVGRIRIDNGSRETIDGVAFPFLGGLAPQSADRPARIVLPSLSQRVFVQTMGAFTGERVNRYPAMLAASWLNYEVGELGVGIEARSGLDAQDAWFALSPGSFQPGSAYRRGYNYPFIAWLSWPHVMADTVWTSPEMRIHLHAGDWHAIAAEHREWFRRQSAADPGTRWDERLGFATYRLKRDDNTIDWGYADLDALADDAAQAGFDRLVVEGWRAVEGPGNPAPRGEIADPRLGGGAALKAANERLAARGVDVLYAFHPTLLNRYAENYPSPDALWSVKTSREAEQIPVSFLAWTLDWPATLSTGHLMVEIDPLSEATDYLLGEAVRIRDEYGFRNLFLKGVGQRAFLSYSRNRGAPPQSVYRLGYEALLGGLRRIYGDGLLLSEGFNDLVNRYGDAGYTWDQGHDAAILPFTAPWQYLSNDVEALDYAAANASFAHKALINLVVDGGRGRVARYPEFARHLRQLQRLKAATAPCCAHAEFRDREGLRDLQAPEQTAVAVFRNRNGSQRGIVLANLDGHPAEVSFELADPVIDGRADLYRLASEGPESTALSGRADFVLQPFEVAVLCLAGTGKSVSANTSPRPPRNTQ